MTAEAPAGRDDQSRAVARFELSLDQCYLDAERVLALMRTRGYELVRLKLAAPGACELLVRIAPAELRLLGARLDRLAGVTVTNSGPGG